MLERASTPAAIAHVLERGIQLLETLSFSRLMSGSAKCPPGGLSLQSTPACDLEKCGPTSALTYGCTPRPSATICGSDGFSRCEARRPLARRRRAGPAPAAVRSRPRTRETSNAKAAPKSAWGVQAQQRHTVSRSTARGPALPADTRPRWRLTDCVGRPRETGQSFAVCRMRLCDYRSDAVSDIRKQPWGRRR
jgi:hypothetical protein